MVICLKKKKKKRASLLDGEKVGLNWKSRHSSNSIKVSADDANGPTRCRIIIHFLQRTIFSKQCLLQAASNEICKSREVRFYSYMHYIYKSPRSLLYWQDEMKDFHIFGSDSNLPFAARTQNVGQVDLSCNTESL